MATFTSTSGSYTTTLTVTETGTSTANNTSTVEFSLTLTKNAGSGLWNYDSCPWSININGEPYSGSFTYDFRSTTSITLKGSTTQTVTHDSDGTKSISVSASVDMDNTPYVYTMSPSGTLALTTIPRASDVSVSNYSIANTSGSISATITSKANFYHRWRWRMNSGSWSSWTNKGLIATTSSTVTVANTTLLAQLPTATSGSFTIEVATYSDSGYATLVGTKSASATVSVNTSNIKPSVSLGNIGINSSPISNYAVAGYSKVQSAWTTTNSSGASSVTTYFTVSTGSLATTSSTATSGTVVSNVIPSNANNYTLTIYAYSKDSRGAVSTTVSKSVTVYGYQPPTANLTAYRTTSSTSTNEDGAGTYAYVTFSGAVRSSVNSQNTIQSTTCTYSGSISGTATNGGHYALADTQSVTFKLTVTDKVTSSTASVSIAQASYPLDLYDDGNGNVGVGLGTPATAGYVITPLRFQVNNSSSSNGGVEIREDSEGGTITIYSPNGKPFEIDSFNDNVLRLYAYDDNSNYRSCWFSRTSGSLGADGGFAGTATNALNVNIQDNNPTSATTTYVPFVTASGNQIEYINDGLRYINRTGTTSTEGYGELTLGNGIALGTEGNKTGWLRMFAPRGAYAEISVATNMTTNRVIYFPNVSGTLAVGETTLWTGTLKSRNGISLGMGNYSKVRVWVCLYGVTGQYIIDLTHTNAVQQVENHPYSSGVTIAEYTAQGVLELMTSQAIINSEKTWFYHWYCGYQTGATATNMNNSDNYYIYRIDGIV